MAGLNQQNVQWWEERIEENKEFPPEVWVGASGRWSELDAIHKKIIGENITAEQKVLDVGCGIGRLAALFVDDKYVGVDFVPRFIEIAQQRNPSKTFFIADVKQPLQFADGEFDWALLVSVKNGIVKTLGNDVWLQVEAELKRVAKNILILEAQAGETNFFELQAVTLSDELKLTEKI